MAFQRPFLISLKRSDSHQKWGFSLKGGNDYGEPLMVQLVAEDSLAEKFGLRENDEIIQVGRVNVQDLSLGQVHEVLARCGNKIEMFIVREDLLSPRKGKEPPVVKAVVHNPYNSPLSLYSTENIADTLAKQTEVLTEGQISTEEDDGPESLSFKQKSAVFQLLEEQSKQETTPYNRGIQQSSAVRKPKTAPPPPPKPKPPSSEHLFNGYDSPQQVSHDQQRSSNRVEYQTTTQKVYQYQQEPSQYQQQTTVYQTSYQSPGYQSPLRENVSSPGYQSSINFQQYPQSPKYEQSYQQQNHISYQQQREGNRSPLISSQQQSQTIYQQAQGNRSPVVSSQQQYPGYQSPVTNNYQQLNQSNYRQTTQGSQHKSEDYQQNQQARLQQQISRDQEHQQSQQSQYQQLNSQYRDQAQQQTSQYQNQNPQSQPQYNYIPQKVELPPSAVSKAEFKIGPPPPPRGTSAKQDTGSMTAIYKQQYEQHLQKQYEQQQVLTNHFDHEDSSKPKAHIIEGNIFEHNSYPGTPVTYKTPPVAPPKPNWPPPPSSAEHFKDSQSCSPNGMMNMASVWPPKKSQVIELPRTGFNPAAVREQQGGGRRCVWPPPADDEFRSGRNTPQSPGTGRRIQWNPSPSPPLNRRTVFSSSQSPSRRKDIQWPPPSPTGGQQDKENLYRPSPRMSRKAKFEDYVHEHASINVPQTYRPPPGTQHIEFR